MTLRGALRGAGRVAAVTAATVATLLMGDLISPLEWIADRRGRADDGEAPDTPAPPVPRAEMEQRPPEA